MSSQARDLCELVAFFFPYIHLFSVSLAEKKLNKKQIAAEPGRIGQQERPVPQFEPRPRARVGGLGRIHGLLVDKNGFPDPSCSQN